MELSFVVHPKSNNRSGIGTYPVHLSPVQYANGYNALMLFSQKYRVFAIAVALLAIAPLCLSAQNSTRRGRKYKAPPPTSRIEVTVLRDTDSKPIENASVIFQLIGEKGNMELKTNQDGHSVIDVLPLGSTMRLQIIAKGYQTYGEDYKIDKANMDFGIRLKRPGEQYSIYKDHSQAGDDQKKDKSKDADTPKDPQKEKPDTNPQSQPR
jgi:hypothetical protein